MTQALQYLLDTDMCIYLLNGDERVKNRVAQVGIEAISVAILTVGELYFGAYNSARVETNLARIRAFLSPPGPSVLPLTMRPQGVSEGSRLPYAVLGNL